MATDKLVDFDHVTDYISRETAIRSAFKLCRNTDYPFIDDIQNAIEEIPAADVRPVVRAHWIDMKPINMETGLPICIKGPDFRCSNCGSAEFQRNFCHNCGADMRGIENGA